MRKITCNEWEYLQVEIIYKDSAQVMILDSCDEVLLGEHDITIIRADNNEVISVNKQLILKHFITTHRYNHCLNVDWLTIDGQVVVEGTIHYNDKEDLDSRRLIHLKRAQKLASECGIYKAIRRSQIKNYHK